MTRQEAVEYFQNKEELNEAEQVALNSLIAWKCVVSDLESKISFSRSCGAKDYAMGMDVSLYTVQQHLKDDNIIC